MTERLETVMLEVEMASILAYAELTDDFNPIHVDPEFAAATPMGGVIAHGTMSLCLLWAAIFRSFPASALRAPELDVRFVKPVRVGDMLRAGGEIDAEDPALYKVWVRADDGSDRIVGTLRLAAAVAQEEAP
ncbi:MaoC family dehydratase [Variovorax sp.]|jgi:3-hydroxybutyryl-CoA dehydratase|uniref:MaoC family dehydratase n=1 Tax=Variovorax sp. TaxID=1871043 RepID=UPI000C4596B2|nr:MaoC family dehydratase [Variovorax sp.]MBS77762.1 acyl dehydratase [Variovorax sp.]